MGVTAGVALFVCDSCYAIPKDDRRSPESESALCGGSDKIQYVYSDKMI